MGAFRNWRHQRREARDILRWRARGSPLPPPHALKRQTIRDYQSRIAARTLIETGTFNGDMLLAMLPHFDRLYSIELFEDSHRKNLERFKPHPAVTLFQGDSATRLPEILSQLKSPAVFWLDAHYSGPGTARTHTDTPIMNELQAIFAHPIKTHAILIDDARCFMPNTDYPTLLQLHTFCAQQRPDLRFEACDDIIRLAPG